MPEPNRPVATAFLSHHSADKDAVEALAQKLEAAGIDCWLDKWNLVPGDPWDVAIEEALKTCAVCVVFVGPSGIGPWHNEEMRAAIRLRVQNNERRMRIVPVLLPGGGLGAAAELPLFLQGTTWVEFRDSIDDTGSFHRLQCGILGEAPGPRFAGTFSLRPGVAADKLPYLCDRSVQWKELCDFLEGRQREDFRRPFVCVVPGAANEAHGPFVERLCAHSLPGQFKRLGLGGTVRLLTLKQRPLGLTAAEFSADLRRLLAEEMQMETVCRTNEDLVRGFHGLNAGVIVVALSVSSVEAAYGSQMCFDLVRSFWAEFPDLPPGQVVVSFIAVKFSSSPAADSPGWFRSMFRSGPTRKESGLRERLAAFGTGPACGPVFCKVLPELASVSREDVFRWAEAADVAPVLSRRISEQRLQEIFAARATLPMDDVIDRLSVMVHDRSP